MQGPEIWDNQQDEKIKNATAARSPRTAPDRPSTDEDLRQDRPADTPRPTRTASKGWDNDPDCLRTRCVKMALLPTLVAGRFLLGSER